MTKLKPGDQVQYIKAHTDSSKSFLILGRTYTIEQVIDQQVKIKYKTGLFGINFFSTMTDETLNTYHLSFTDHTLILNALHYYKKVEKRDEFKQFTDEIINNLRDRMCKQLVDNAWDELPSWRKE